MGSPLRSGPIWQRIDRQNTKCISHKKPSIIFTINIGNSHRDWNGVAKSPKSISRRGWPTQWEDQYGLSQKYRIKGFEICNQKEKKKQNSNHKYALSVEWE